jgi:hypothetical protein
MDKTGIHHVDSIVFLCYGFLSLAKTLRAQRVSRYSRRAFRADGYKREKAVERTDHRLFNKLHARGLIAKIPRSRRWRVTQKGWRVLGPLVETCA